MPRRAPRRGRLRPGGDHRGGPRHDPAGRASLASRPADAPTRRRRAHRRREDARTPSPRPRDEAERLFYGFSILTCLPAVMTEQPTAAIGTVIRADTMHRLATRGGLPERRAARRAGARHASLLPDDAVESRVRATSRSPRCGHPDPRKLAVRMPHGRSIGPLRSSTPRARSVAHMASTSSTASGEDHA